MMPVIVAEELVLGFALEPVVVVVELLIRISGSAAPVISLAYTQAAHDAWQCCNVAVGSAVGVGALNATLHIHLCVDFHAVVVVPFHIVLVGPVYLSLFLTDVLYEASLLALDVGQLVQTAYRVTGEVAVAVEGEFGIALLAGLDVSHQFEEGEVGGVEDGVGSRSGSGGCA